MCDQTISHATEQNGVLALRYLRIMTDEKSIG